MKSLFLAAALLASPVGAASVASPSPVVSGGSALLQGLLGLFIVLAILMGLFWFLRRFSPGQTAAQGVVKVVGGVMLGTREKLVVVEVGDTWLLLGVGGGQVNTLHTLPRPEGVSAPALHDPLTGFSDKLKEVLQRRRAG
jgi:flagellar protein FliO/FliZ